MKHIYVVKSKYKNPDKYIDKLKKDIEWYIATKNAAIERNSSEMIVSWSSDTEDNIGVNGDNFMQLRIDDLISTVGKVKEIKSYKNLCGKICSAIKIARIKTKKIKLL